MCNVYLLYIYKKGKRTEYPANLNKRIEYPAK